MAKQSKLEGTEETKSSQLKKLVRNRNDYKVELFIDGSVVVFPPHRSAEVPATFDVPANLGLYEA